MQARKVYGLLWSLGSWGPEKSYFDATKAPNEQGENTPEKIVFYALLFMFIPLDYFGFLLLKVLFSSKKTGRASWSFCLGNS